MDVEKFVRHLCRLVLRHQMPVWNYIVNSFYSAPCGLEALVRPKCFVQGRYARVPHDQAGAEAAGALRNPHMNYFKTSA